MPEVLDSVYLKQGIIEGEDENVDAVVSDKASGLYGSFLSGGLIVAPILGSLVYETIAKKLFTATTDVFALACLAWTLLFFICNYMLDIRKDKKEQI